MKKLTGNKDVDREILKWVNDRDLLKVCSINKNFWNTVCDDNFLKRRLLSKYPGIENFKYADQSWKDFFLDATYHIAKMQEDFEFSYTKGNFRRQHELLERNKNVNKLLITASRKGELPLVIFALNNGANIHTGFNGTEEDALADASENGHLEVVKYLVESGADVNGDKTISLRNASKNGHLSVVKYLIDKGADIHARYDESLLYASFRGHLDVVKYLVEHGADVNADSRILLLPVKEGYYEVVKYLIEHDAEIGPSLILASRKGHLSIVKLLVEHGADIHINNDAALNYAHEKGYTSIQKYLMKHGAVLT